MMGMKANITEDELKMLAYLHEHAGGCGERHSMGGAQLCRELGLADKQLSGNLSYLEGHDLAGARVTDASSFNGQFFIINSIWLTSNGEDYMRELENQPGVPKKVTLAVVKQMGTAFRDIAIGVLTNWLTKPPGG
jgi:hypothetical protein